MRNLRKVRNEGSNARQPLKQQLPRYSIGRGMSLALAIRRKGKPSHCRGCLFDRSSGSMKGERQVTLHKFKDATTLRQTERSQSIHSQLAAVAMSRHFSNEVYSQIWKGMG